MGLLNFSNALLPNDSSLSQSGNRCVYSSLSKCTQQCWDTLLLGELRACIWLQIDLTSLMRLPNIQICQTTRADSCKTINPGFTGSSLDCFNFLNHLLELQVDARCLQIVSSLFSDGLEGVSLDAVTIIFCTSRSFLLYWPFLHLKHVSFGVFLFVCVPVLFWTSPTSSLDS